MTNVADFDAALALLSDQVRGSQLPEPERRRSIRESAGLSLSAMAGVLHVATMTAQRWETGASRPRIEDAIRYRRLLDSLEQATDAGAVAS